MALRASNSPHSPAKDRAREMIMLKTCSWFRAVAAVMAVITALTGVFVGEASAQKRGLPLIRDAEIEGLLRLYTRPIFKAAGINPKSVKVYVINDPRINAFVAGGQRIFVNTGLLSQADTPNEVIGVLAHETGHIAGGHLTRMGVEIELQAASPREAPRRHRRARASWRVRRASPSATSWPMRAAWKPPPTRQRFATSRRPGSPGAA
jgi:hypothetical protein